MACVFSSFVRGNLSMNISIPKSNAGRSVVSLRRYSGWVAIGFPFRDTSTNEYIFEKVSLRWL
ncbi:hypothetical protein ENUP19_0084G0037 [Entamoeba nuttalli]|uniref:Uncharacterized protein n=1 Tax=Entamoeba nuttalli TaxID=412467 RepID=A0ABQ0DG11_9EUKA